MPSNFRTYEAQSRLLVAVLASNPGLKLNFKAIAQHYGSDTSMSGIEHRFRPIKKQAEAIRNAVAQGIDAKDLANIVTMNEKDIAKYYGESTPMGIEFQFRSIKKEAKALRDSMANGGEAPPIRKGTPNGGSSAPATPPKSGVKRRAAAPKSGSSLALSSTAKRFKQEFLSNEEDDMGEVDYEQLDLTPTRPNKRKNMLAKIPMPATPVKAATPAPASTPGTATTANTAATPAAPASTATALPTPSLTSEATPEGDDELSLIDPPPSAPITGQAPAAMPVTAQSYHQQQPLPLPAIAYNDYFVSTYKGPVPTGTAPVGFPPNWSAQQPQAPPPVAAQQPHAPQHAHHGVSSFYSEADHMGSEPAQSFAFSSAPSFAFEDGEC